MEECKNTVHEICGAYPRNITTSFRQFVAESEKPRHLNLCVLRNAFYYIIPSTTDDGKMIYMPWFWLLKWDMAVYFMLHETLHQINPAASEDWVTLECKRRYAIWMDARMKARKSKKSHQGS